MLKIFRGLATKTAPTTSAVPDAATFLQKIGRNMTQYAENFETWESLMNAQSTALKEKGMPTRDRRYLLAWIERFKQHQELHEFKRGRKKWGGERNRNANRAAFYGRKKAEEREKAES